MQSSSRFITDAKFPNDHMRWTIIDVKYIYVYNKLSKCAVWIILDLKRCAKAGVYAAMKAKMCSKKATAWTSNEPIKHFLNFWLVL